MNQGRSMLKRRTEIFASLIVAMATVGLKAQTVDFSIDSVTACPIDANNFQVVFAHGIALNGSTFINGTEVTIRVAVAGPSTAAPVEDHKVKLYAPAPNPHKGCAGSDPCSAGSCEDWVGKFKGKLYTAKAACLVAPDACECVSSDAAPPKEKPKHDGPGNYTITVTIDPDNAFPELSEANNSLQFVLLEGAALCQTSAIGACCLPDGSCQDDLTNTACSGLDGDYQGDTSSCASAQCPVKGACCERSTSDCLIPVAKDVCLGLGGVYHGDFSTVCPLSAMGDCIPTLTEWGVAVMTLLVLTAATIVLLRRRSSLPA